jgi:uncharacterized protein (TIGR02453 family)
MSIASASFVGFTPDAIQFLADLAENNERAWFQPRKADYERLLKDPLERLCEAVDGRFRARRIPLQADTRRSPFRIYRDTRFSHDKSPYKTNVAASFPWIEDGYGGLGGTGNPGGYFHLAPGEVFVGGGMWHPSPGKLAAFRRSVAEDPAAIRGLLDDPTFATRFGPLSGDTLTRPPRGYPADHPEVELLKHRDITFGVRLADEDVLSARLPDVVADVLADSVPFMRYLARL